LTSKNFLTGTNGNSDTNFSVFSNSLLLVLVLTVRNL